MVKVPTLDCLERHDARTRKTLADLEDMKSVGIIVQA